MRTGHVQKALKSKKKEFFSQRLSLFMTSFHAGQLVYTLKPFENLKDYKKLLTN
jgi:hypothetical protein